MGSSNGKVFLGETRRSRSVAATRLAGMLHGTSHVDVQLGFPLLLQACAPGDAPTLNTRSKHVEKHGMKRKRHSSGTAAAAAATDPRAPSAAEATSTCSSGFRTHSNDAKDQPQPPERQYQETHTHPQAAPHIRRVECTHRLTPCPTKSRILSQAPGSRPAGRLSTCSRPQAIAQGLTCIFERARGDIRGRGNRVRRRRATTKPSPKPSYVPGFHQPSIF